MQLESIYLPTKARGHLFECTKFCKKFNNPYVDMLMFLFYYLIYRFLACHKSGIKFTFEESDLYSKSWIKSCDTTCQMFDLIKKKKPHETKKTVSLNEARNCIIAMSKPMGQAVQLIEMNLKKIKDAKDQCTVYDADIKSFQADLKFKGYELCVNQLDHPMTVCADTQCKRYVRIGTSREQNTIYEQICHDSCGISGVPLEVTNNEQLRGCAAMDNNGKCKHCRHDYRVHMHMTYTVSVVEKEFLSEDAKANIQKKSDLKSQKRVFMEEMEKSIKEFEDEKKFIFYCASFFGAFLKQNAMIAYNDSFNEYLDMLIKDEQAKEKEIRDDQKIEQMKQDKITYNAKKDIIVKSIATENKDEILPIERIYEMRQKLCSLKHNGKSLKEALGIVRIHTNINICFSRKYSRRLIKSYRVFFSKSNPICINCEVPNCMNII